MNMVLPLGGGSVQPPVDAGAGQTAASGEGERGGPDSPETRAEEPSKHVTFKFTVQRSHRTHKYYGFFV